MARVANINPNRRSGCALFADIGQRLQSDACYETLSDSSSQGEGSEWVEQDKNVIEQIDFLTEFCSDWVERRDILTRLVTRDITVFLDEISNCVKHLRTLQQPIPTELSCFDDPKRFQEWFTFRQIALYILEANISKKVLHLIQNDMCRVGNNAQLREYYRSLLSFCNIWNTLQNYFQVCLRDKSQPHHHFYIYCKL